MALIHTRRVTVHGQNNHFKRYQMKYNRRKFLQITGATSAGLFLGSVGGLSLFSSCKTASEKDIAAYDLQLYTLRDNMPKDPRGVLKQVAEAGYKQIESYEGPQGIFWGMSNTDFKKYMDDLGMTIVASHADIEKDFEQKAEQSAAIGMKYLICPWLGAQPTIDDYKKKAELFNKCGEICKKAGLKFAYHNHDYSFKPLEGQVPQQVMMDNTDPDLVEYEMDIYWVVTAGEDPEAWLKKYKNRFRLCHVKDRAKEAADNDASCILGEGSIDFPRILKTAKENGMDYFIVEQERYDNSTPLDSMRANAAYMENFRFV